MKKNLAIILAGGTGSRISTALPKQFLKLAGKTVLEHTINAFESHPSIEAIFIVSHGDYLEQTKEIVNQSGFKKVVKLLRGGEFRQDSSRIGVMAAEPGSYDCVLIHDAARPFVSRTLIDTILEKLNEYKAVNVAIPSADTIIEINDSHFITSVPDRNSLRRVQTPQGFDLELIRTAHIKALENHITNATDDCSLILNLKTERVFVVEGNNHNIKITYPIDLMIAEKILEGSDGLEEKR